MSANIKEFVDRLAARGVRVELRHGRVKVTSSAYKTLSGDETSFMRHHRVDIKAYLEHRHDEPIITAESTPAPVADASASAPVKCPYCGQTPCVGRDHHSYDILHRQDPEHVEARNKAATAEMRESMRRYGPARY